MTFLLNCILQKSVGLTAIWPNPQRSPHSIPLPLGDKIYSVEDSQIWHFRLLTHDHTLEAGHVALLGSDLEVRVDDAGIVVS